MIQRDYKADLKTAHEEIGTMEKEIAALQEFKGGIIGLLASRGKILKAPEKIIQDMMEQIASLREVVQDQSEQIAALKDEIWHLKSAMKADDLRLVAAAEKAGEVDMGCDIPDWLAETVVEQREQLASLKGDNEILRNMNKILKESLDACYGVRIGPQEPLGEEFQKVLDDNRDKLYEDGALRGEEEI